MARSISPIKTTNPVASVIYCHIVSGVSGSVNWFYITITETTYVASSIAPRKTTNVVASVIYCHIISGVSRKLILYSDN